MTRKPACRLSKSLFLLLLGCLLFFALPGALAAVQVQIDGETVAVQARTRVANGISYVAVEELFQELGGIAYYSPIMKKIHLRLGRKTCTVSLDKKTVVIGEEEFPLSEKDVLIEGSTAYVSFAFLETLFALSPAPASQGRTETPRPSPQRAESPSFRPSLVGIRHHAYEEEARTRVTLDFSGTLPTYSYQIDRPSNRLDVILRNSDLAAVPSSIPVKDRRVDRVEVRKEADRVVVSLFFTVPVTVRDGKLPGDEKPRIYFDLVSLVEAETKPVTTAQPTPSPTPRVTPPGETTPPPKTVTPTPFAAIDRLNPRVIVIDPGHGGKDPGCVYHGYREKDIVLQVAKLLKSFLEKDGFQVFMTRSGDTYPTLEERYDLVNKTVPLLFVSLHCNAAPNPGASGIEVFVGSSRPKGEGALEVANRENEFFLAQQKAVPNYTTLDRFLSDTYYLTSREASLELGSLLIDKVAAQTGQVKRGTKEAPLVILRNIYSPAILVEIGFLSNPKEARNLASSAFQTKIAQGMAEAIKAFSQSEKVRKLLQE